jgi:hypothetical protein
MTIWAPVVAALGASLLTGGFTWGASWWAERRRDRAAERREKSTAYHQFISCSLTFSGRMEALRNVMESRSGLKEGIDGTCSPRRPLDDIDVYEWLEKDFVPINNAWSKIQMIGSSEAVDEATQLLNACAELLKVATTPGEAQRQALQAAGRQVIDAREAFIKVARKELGREQSSSGRGNDAELVSGKRRPPGFVNPRWPHRSLGPFQSATARPPSQAR